VLKILLHQPRKLWARKALFQIHLWLGILLSLYVIAISLSGSILVFQDEIRRASLKQPPLDSSRVASVGSVIAETKKHYPKLRLTYVALPQEPSPWWTLYLDDAQGKRRIVYADAASGVPIQQTRRLLIDVVLNLHVYLLAGETGFVVNCVAGIGLLTLALTGAILWWPGIRLWRRALGVSLRHGWKRVNYDLHNAVGIWTLLIVSWWGMTAIYFLFPTKVSMVVNAISPLVAMKPPVVAEQAPSTAVVSIDRILDSFGPASLRHVSGVGLPESAGGKVTIYIDRGKPGDFSHRDIVTVSGHTGKQLATWHYGENRSAGDWALWFVYPLHFGTLWGLGVKVLWAFLGLCVSLLSVTGLLMYWNRKLRKVLGAVIPDRQ
jgi:uncharacterized iron-regulated membrane protein